MIKQKIPYGDHIKEIKISFKDFYMSNQLEENLGNLSVLPSEVTKLIKDFVLGLDLGKNSIVTELNLTKNGAKLNSIVNRIVFHLIKMY